MLLIKKRRDVACYNINELELLASHHSAVIAGLSNYNSFSCKVD
uniref:Uncharacterized protein n=1 Tax=Anguilla anguilla TaxID=7936 RepID=A0A0E9WY94_ANGAN